MNIISEINEIKNKISGKILFNESLSKYSWFNLGGPAKIIFKPENLNELSLFLKPVNPDCVHCSRFSSFPMIPLVSIIQDLDTSGSENTSIKGETNPELLM